MRNSLYTLPCVVEVHTQRCLTFLLNTSANTRSKHSYIAVRKPAQIPAYCVFVSRSIPPYPWGYLCGSRIQMSPKINWMLGFFCLTSVNRVLGLVCDIWMVINSFEQGILRVPAVITSVPTDIFTVIIQIRYYQSGLFIILPFKWLNIKEKYNLLFNLFNTHPHNFFICNLILMNIKKACHKNYFLLHLLYII